MKEGTITVRLGGEVKSSLCQFCDQTECGISKEKACVQACTVFMERVMCEEVRHTIHEWEVLKNVVIMDPDGFNRNDPDLYKRKFTEKEFDDAFPLCTALRASPGSKTKFWNDGKLVSLGGTIKSLQRLEEHKSALEEELFSTKMCIDETKEDIDNLTAQLDEPPISTVSKADADLIAQRLATSARQNAEKCSQHNSFPQSTEGLDKYEEEHMGCNECGKRSDCENAKHNNRCGLYAYASCEDDL